MEDCLVHYRPVSLLGSSPRLFKETHWAESGMKPVRGIPPCFLLQLLHPDSCLGFWPWFPLRMDNDLLAKYTSFSSIWFWLVFYHSNVKQIKVNTNLQVSHIRKTATSEFKIKYLKWVRKSKAVKWTSQTEWLSPHELLFNKTPKCVLPLLLAVLSEPRW